MTIKNVDEKNHLHIWEIIYNFTEGFFKLKNICVGRNSDTPQLTSWLQLWYVTTDVMTATLIRHNWRHDRKSDTSQLTSWLQLG